MAKQFLNWLWLLKLYWNNVLPDKEAKEWKCFSSELKILNSLEIEKCILTENSILIEIHGFADASKVAYGAEIYCKLRSNNHKAKVRLIPSKSRVSAIKRVTSYVQLFR